MTEFEIREAFEATFSEDERVPFDEVDGQE